MKPIGPTFAQELETAGLLGLPFSWGADGDIEFDVSMSPQQVAAVQAVYAAHNPAAQPKLTTTELRAAALDALQSDPKFQPQIDNLVTAIAAQPDAPPEAKEFAATNP